MLSVNGSAIDDLRSRIRATRWGAGWCDFTDSKLINDCAALDAIGDVADPAVAMRYTLASLALRWPELHDEIETHSRHLERLTHHTVSPMRSHH